MTRNVAISGAAFTAALATFAAIVAQQGCTVLTNDALPDDAGVFEGGDADGASAACGTCVVAQCAGPLSVCLTDEACVAASLCAQGGADATGCACSASDDGGADGGVAAAAAFRAAQACEGELECVKCATECACSGASAPLGACGDAGVDSGADAATQADAGATDSGGDAGEAGADSGTTADAGTLGPGAACATCAASKCGDASRACGAGTECEAFLACTRACSTTACADDCNARHATGKTAAGELARCTTISCLGPCGF